MKTLGLILITLCLTGVISPEPVQRQECQPPPDNLSLDEVREVERKLPCLKAGMSREEVFGILGAKVAESEVRGSGPGWDFRIIHRLRGGYGLLLVWGEGRRFKRAEVLGEVWRKEREARKRPGEAGRHPANDCKAPAGADLSLTKPD